MNIHYLRKIMFTLHNYVIVRKFSKEFSKLYLKFISKESLKHKTIFAYFYLMSFTIIDFQV